MDRYRRGRTILAGAVLALSGGLAAPAAASEYPLDFPYEVRTMAVVPQLNLEAGVGWLTVRIDVHSESYTGFEVEIPAGDGAWVAVPVRAVPELGVVCREAPGPDLHYRCGDTSGAPTGLRLPLGGYQVSFRVQHTGHPDGLTGRSFVNAVVHGDVTDPGLGRLNPDIFPVREQPHTRSTAEIALARFDWTPGAVTLPVSLAVVPGERVSALDLTLPWRYSWRATGTNADQRGLQCFVRTSGPSLHCRPRVGAAVFPVGRYGLTVHLMFAPIPDSWPPWSSPQGRAQLSVNGDPAAGSDDFPWRVPSSY